MKVLLVHNHYGTEAPSGENRVFELEKKLLSDHGHEVETFEYHSDKLRSRGMAGKVVGALMTPWNPVSAQQMSRVVDLFRPDIVHAHNTFPMISPSIFRSCGGAGRVLTLHNYRLACPAAIPLRNGETCTKCIDRSSILPAMRYGCYRSSRIATAPIAANVALHRSIGTWQNQIDAYIALSKFQRELMIKAGLPAEKVMVKPNFYPGTPKSQPFEIRRNQAVFVGRLGEEKGVRDLIDAWIDWGDAAPGLVIVGDGTLRQELEEKTIGRGNIRLMGQVSSSEAEDVIASSKMLILPSRWFEGFPMVLREAFALGTPVAVSDQGPLPEIASQASGIIFRAGSPKDILAKIKHRWADQSGLALMARASKNAFTKNYSESKNLDDLLQVYNFAMRERESRLA